MRIVVALAALLLPVFPAVQPVLTDRDIAVAGTMVHLRCGGTRAAGAPLVVLEAGAGAGANSWLTVPPAVAAFARVCAYDRPGTPGSGPYPKGMTAAGYPVFLHNMLEAAGEPPPYLIVGHSFGGIVASLHAMRIPSDVTGLVLVDSSHEDQQRRLEPVTGPPPPKRDPVSPPPGVPAPPPPGLRFEEFSVELRKTPFRRDIPLVVLTGTRAPATKDPMDAAVIPVFIELHQELASRSARSEHRLLPNSGHLVPRDDPQAIVDAVKKVLTWP
jgi:pimeloyl-ACP methyl ester carboxylesterase